MKKYLKIDFTLLPDLSYTSMWIRLDQDLEVPLSKLSETYDRVQGVLLFAAGVSNSPDGSLKSREAFLRASLGEFVSMEEALKRDLVKNGVSKPPIKSNETQYPLLHIIRELRNLEFHLRSSILLPEQKLVLWGNVSKPENATKFEHTIWRIGDITQSQFATLQNANKYEKDHIEKLLNWFNDAQKSWGINDLVIRAVNHYSRIIVENYKL